MDGFHFGPKHSSNHLKILHTYLKAFKSLESLTFRWRGPKGRFPLALATEPCAVTLTLPVESKACPKTIKTPPFSSLKFRHLKVMRMENATIDTAQIAALVEL